MREALPRPPPSIEPRVPKVLGLSSAVRPLATQASPSSSNISVGRFLFSLLAASACQQELQCRGKASANRLSVLVLLGA